MTTDDQAAVAATAGRRTLILHALLIAGAGLAFAWPLLRHGLPYGHDTVQHVCWYQCFADQFWSGDLYPRWLMKANDGLGSPIFFVYGPLPYIITSLLRPLAVALWGGGNPVVELGLSAALALVASGLAAYAWLRRATTPAMGLAGALLYLLVPYHVAIDLYVRGALAEFWAFVWMPLALYFTHRLVEGRRSALAGWAVAYALLILTHVFTALIFTPVPLLYAVVLSWGNRPARALRRVAAAMALGLGLSALYLLPALEHQNHISAERLIRQLPREYEFQRNFLFAGAAAHEHAPQGPFPQHIAWVSLATAATAAGAFAWVFVSGDDTARRRAAFWFALAAASLFAMLPASKFAWQMLPLLQRIQFPWRFNTILCVATAALLALCGAGLRRPLGTARMAVGALTLASVAVWLYPAARAVARAEAWHTPPPGFTHRAMADSHLPISYDYLTIVWAKWTDPQFLGPAGIRDLGRRFGEAAVLSGGGSVSVERWVPREIRLKTESAGAGALVLRRLYYPAWRAEVSGAETAVQPSAREGLIEVRVPAGRHEVRLALPPSGAERVGAGVSVVSGLIALALALPIRRRSASVAS